MLNKVSKDWAGAGFVTTIGLAILIFVPILFDLFEVLQMTQYVVLSLFALSLAYIWGFGGILSFGQAGFFGLGGYTYAVSAINMGQTTIPFLMAIGLCALFAAALGYFMFYGRLNDVYLGVVTLVVTLILWKLINHTAGPEYIIGKARLGGFNGMPSIPIMTLPWKPDMEMEPGQMFQYFMAILIGVYVLLHVLIKSKFGRVAISIRENEIRTGLLGYDVRLYKLGIFTIGGAIGGAAGAMWATYQTFIDPNSFSLEVSAKCLIWVMAGGVGTLFGPIVGVIGLQYLSLKLGETDLLNNLIILGTILMFLVLVLPKGIFPSFRDLVQWLWRRVGASGRERAP
jgi:branched-chain amino acid transport system permease protein